MRQLNKCVFAAALFAAATFVSPAHAATIPYPNTGTENPQTYTFTASTTGDVFAYFMGKGPAGDSETVGLLVNGVSTGFTGLNNQTSFYGQSLDLGLAHAGDKLTFVLNVLTTNNTWYSDRAKNTDGLNHVYSTSFAGDNLIPPGVYLGFEDLSVPGVDFNYTDEQVAFAQVSSVPLPSTLPMFAAAILALGTLAWRRQSAR